MSKEDLPKLNVMEYGPGFIIAGNDWIGYSVFVKGEPMYEPIFDNIGTLEDAKDWIEVFYGAHSR